MANDATPASAEGKTVSDNFTPKHPKTGAFSAKARKAFLDHLAESSNVTASAKVAEVHSSLVYRERLRSPDFRAQWLEALAEGYVRLETSLLGEALVSASGTIADKTLKARDQKIKLGLSLLSAHRASVRGGVPASGRKRVVLQGTAKQRVVMKLREMRARMAEPDGSC